MGQVNKVSAPKCYIAHPFIDRMFQMNPLPRPIGSNRGIKKAELFCGKLSGPLLLAFFLGLVIPAATVHAANERGIESEFELTNFAFANYLGSGFYSSGDSTVFIVKLPLSTTLRQVTETEPGWVVNYPVSLGLANIDDDFLGIEDIPGLSDIGTISAIPGIEYVYPVLSNWQLAPFLDLGIARDVRNDISVRVRGTGVKSFVTFDYDASWLTFANRLLQADQKNLDSGDKSDFAVFETALEYTLPTSFTLGESAVDVSYYFINYHYLNELVLFESVDSRISLEDKNEVGFTFILQKHSWLPDNFQLGLGIQVTKNTNLYRIVIGAPFF